MSSVQNLLESGYGQAQVNHLARDALFEFGTGVSLASLSTQGDLSLYGFERSSTSASPDYNCITMNNHLRMITPVYPCAQYLFLKVIDRVWTIWKIRIRQAVHTWPSYCGKESSSGDSGNKQANI